MVATQKSKGLLRDRMYQLFPDNSSHQHIIGTIQHYFDTAAAMPLDPDPEWQKYKNRKKELLADRSLECL